MILNLDIGGSMFHCFFLSFGTDMESRWNGMEPQPPEIQIWNQNGRMEPKPPQTQTYFQFQAPMTLHLSKGRHYFNKGTVHRFVQTGNKVQTLCERLHTPHTHPKSAATAASRGPIFLPRGLPTLIT